MQNIDAIIAALNKEKTRRSKLQSKFDWELNARTEQKLPQGNWFGWLIMAGRGFGKTRAAAEAIKKLALSGEYKRICLLGETYDQVRSIMIEGESGLLNIHTKEQRPKYYPSKKELVWKNGCIAACFSAENYEALRGPQFDLAWVDELAKFDNASLVWDQLMFCLRLGNQPKVIISTTPRPKKLIQELINRADIVLTKGSTFDNAKNLSSNFLDMIKLQYGNTQLAKQEIEGQILENDTNELWNYSSFVYEDHDYKDMEIIIAIDPAISATNNSCETGIIVAGKKDDKYYVLEDCSTNSKAEIWVQTLADLTKKYNPLQIVVETNQGGEILFSWLKSCVHANWKSLRAKESKYKRAQPIASLYQQKKVIHVKKFEKLEKQLVNAHLDYENDRMDALVWAIFSLMHEIEAPSDFRVWTC